MMGNKQKLEELIKKRNKIMEEISEDIGSLECLLKKSTFMDFQSSVYPEAFHLCWDSEKKRLCMKDFEGKVLTPLIETKAHIREIAHKYLDKFIEELINREKKETNDGK